MTDWRFESRSLLFCLSASVALGKLPDISEPVSLSVRGDSPCPTTLSEERVSSICGVLGAVPGLQSAPSKGVL